MKIKKMVRCLYVKQPENGDKLPQPDLQEVLCRAFARRQKWEVSSESYASLSFDDEITPNIFTQLVDICCTAPMSKFDVLLIASRPCLGIPEAYIEQVTNWLHQNHVETWSVVEGKLTQ